MKHSTKLAFAASIAAASLIVGCQTVPDNDVSGGIVSGSEVMNNREKMHQQNNAVVGVPATSGDAAHPVLPPLHSTTAPAAGAQATPVAAPAASGDAAAAPAGPAAPAAPVAPGTPAAPAPAAPQ